MMKLLRHKVGVLLSATSMVMQLKHEQAGWIMLLIPFKTKVENPRDLAPNGVVCFERSRPWRF